MAEKAAPMELAAAYPESFFSARDEAALRSARAVVPHLLGICAATSVLDVGCGTGTWLKVFRDEGVSIINGVDGPWVSPYSLHIPPECFIAAQLDTKLTLDRRYDLALCLEVVEHLPPKGGDRLLDTLVAAADVVVFSAAIPFQGGTHHVNEQWPSYWIRSLGRLGYTAIDCVRPVIWSDPTIEFHYAQNMFVAASEEGLRRWPGLAEAHRCQPWAPPDLVHPRLFTQSTVFAKEPGELFQATLGALRDRWLRRDRGRAKVSTRQAARWPLA